MKPKINRLYADIEVSPDIAFTWRIGYKVSLNHDNILKERAIICIGFKWEHQKKAQCIYWDKNQDDRALLEEFIAIANTADEIVMHNGDSFDLPWIRTRCLFHGLPMMPAYKTIDTLQWARRKFYFNSNRLDYIAKFLGMGGKLKTEFGLWKSIVLQSDGAALKRMVTYCKKDVALLEQVWKRMASHVPHKTHAGVLAGRYKWEGESTVHCLPWRVRLQCSRGGSRVTGCGGKRVAYTCR